MSDPRLGLPEVNAYIIELLRNKPNALKCRCLVSKTWDSRQKTLLRPCEVHVHR